MSTRRKSIGRIAMAWLIIITMVFATMSTPFANAATTDECQKGVTVTKVDSRNAEYIIGGENDYIFIKQATAEHGTYAVWTREALTTEQKAQLIDVINDQPSSTDATVENTTFYVGFGVHSNYTFSENANGDIVLANPDDKISHLLYGHWCNHEHDYDISVTKAVTLDDDESTAGVNGTVYVSLFSDAAYTTMVTGTTPQMVTVTNGVATTATFSVDEMGTYYVAETDSAGNVITAGGMMFGYHLASIDNSHPDGVEVTAEGSALVTITNNLESMEEVAGSISVTKKVAVLGADPETTVNYTFYAALFEDQDGTMVKVSDVKALQVINSQATTVTFDGLDLNKTYHVYETDSEGNIIQTDAEGKIATPIIEQWTDINYENAVVTLTANNMEGESTITNLFNTEGFPLQGSIMVNKTVTVNGKEYASNRTFYVALFADKELTNMVSEVKPLMMNNKSTTSTEFLEDKDGNPLDAGRPYYIAETDKDGAPLTGSVKELGFDIEIDNMKIVIEDEDNIVNIINKFKSEAFPLEENPQEGSLLEESLLGGVSMEEFPLTGDNSSMSLWLMLAMLGVAGAIAPIAFRKQGNLNDKY